MKNIATQLITQKFCKFFYLLACLAIFSNINTTITFNDQDVSSVVTAFTLLQQRQTDDPIAQEIVAKSAQTLKGKVAALHQFNERLRKRQEDDAIAEAHGLSPVKPGENLSDKISAKAKFQQAAAAMAHQAALKQAEEERLALQAKAEAERLALQAKAEEDRLAAEEQERKLQAELQAAKEKASLFSPMKAKLAEASTEIERLKSQPVGLGGGSARPIDQLVATISLAKNITIKEMIFNDAAFTVAVHINLNGQDVTYQVDGMDSEEYDRLKIFLALSARMHSKTFNAASSAVGDLLTDILSSSAPQAYHLKQTAQLAATTSRLDEFLNYHIALQQKLTGLAALPLSNFLAIRFLSTDAVEFTRSQVLGEFKAIHDQIPLQDELALGSQALDKFLKKIASSIELPTEIEFSTKEIEDIFKELGLLLETDSDGIVIDSEYYTQLLKFSEKFTALKKAMLSKNEELYESAPVKAALKAIEESILAANPALPSNFEQICAGFNDLINIGIAANGLQKSVKALQALTEDDRSLNMPLQDDGLVTQALKIEGTETASIQAVLFLLQKFAKTQFDNVIKNSIVGNLDPAIQAACTTYYKRAQQDIKKALLNAAGFAFNERNYKKLKGSENVTFIKLYLESITTGNPIVVNLDELKERTLGIQSSIEAKRKTVLILRVSDLLYSSAFQPKLSVEEATAISERSADFDNPAIADAVLQYELQDNTLKTERDKKRFLDAYLRVRLAKPSSTSSSSSDPSEVSHEDKVRRLKDFFALTLASTAKDVDLVKLVLTLPTLKRGYEASFDKFKEVVNEFNSVYASGPSSSSASDTRISALRKAFTDIDSVCTEDERPTLKRTLDKLLQLQEISQKFLTVGNNTGAMVSAADSLLQDSSFRVTAGISQLEFDTVLKNTDYNVFYNAVKILNLIALAMPSADDFSLIEELMLAKIPPEESEKKEQLKQLLIDVIKMANEMRQQSTEFYGQITALMQFVNNFEKQKNKYDESSGEECINFHERLDALSGTKPKPAVLAIAK
ncbi:MAG: cell envelope integrity protein TolA [Proteobacteria bacterium]|nr:cell envelope integrity protein TolA [Pseudomonadota bacterium]